MPQRQRRRPHPQRRSPLLAALHQVEDAPERLYADLRAYVEWSNKARNWAPKLDVDSKAFDWYVAYLMTAPGFKTELKSSCFHP